MHLEALNIPPKTGLFPKLTVAFRPLATMATKKTRRVMKLTLFLLLAACLQAGAKGYSQNITLSLKEAPIEKVFIEIQKQTNYQFFYNERLLRKAKKVSFDVRNMPLKTVLELCFKDQALTFEIDDRQIIVKVKNEKENDETLFTPPPPIDISGKITDDEGNPLVGASVNIKGSSLGTSTNSKGEFALKGVDENAILKISFIGFAVREIKASSIKNGTTLVLQKEEGKLEEVVVNGFQSIEKKKFTGATTKLSGDEVKMSGVLDVSRMLEGKVAGVAVQNVSGTFGTAPKVRIRGATSISGENKPLWVVDGVVLEDVINISNDELSSGNQNTLLGSSVAGLNADDIETFDILKDASATALYGARAMNGVIVITTKKGRAGKAQIAYNGNFSSLLKPNYNNFNIMNSADQMSVYAEMLRKGWLNSTTLATAGNYGVFGKMYDLINAYDASNGTYGLENTPEARAAFLNRYKKANTDWFDVLFKNSLTQEHSISISSGHDGSQFYLSTSFYNDNGWAMGNSVKRYTANMRGNYKINNKLDVGFITLGSIREQTAPGTNDRVDNVVAGNYERTFDINPYSYSLNTSRTLTAYDENGNLEYFTRNYAPFNIIHELDNNRVKVNVLDLKLQGEIKYKILKNLQYSAIGLIRYVKTSREQEMTEYSNMALAYRANGNSIIRDKNNYLYIDPDDITALPEVVLPKGGFYNRFENSLKNLNLRNTLAYNKAFNRIHNINILVGQEIKYADRQDAYNKGYGYQYDNGGIAFTDYRIIKDLLEQNQDYYGMSMSYDRFMAYFGNMNYAFDNKYVLNATVRYDGSNKLGGSRKARWLPTWTVGGAWNVDAEPFMSTVHEVDYLKVRASYGLTASMGDATNSTVVLANGTARRPYLSEKESLIGISYLENKELTWEKLYSANLGFDIGLLKDKINLSVDVYDRRSFDLISTLKTAGIGGQAYKTANYADMRSKGMEATFGTRFIKSKTWSWSTNLTFGYNTNKITKLKNIPRIYDLVIPEGGAYEGHPVRALYSVPFLGLNPENGMPVFTNELGKSDSKVYLQSNTVDYLIYEGPVDPTITGGFSNTVSYKNFSLNFLVSYQAGNKIRLTPQFKTSYTDLDAMPKEFLNRWVSSGDELKTNIPSIISKYESFSLSSSYPYNNYNYSNVRVADGSFVRLKTVSLSYVLNPTWAKAAGLKNASVTVTGLNLWLIYSDKKLQGQDPEFFTSGGVALPMPRQFTATLKVGL